MSSITAEDPSYATIEGVDLPVDPSGLVDLSAIKRYSKQTDRSPSQWARSPRFTQVVRRVMAKTGQPFDELWRVEGFRKAARTWAHPLIAQAYIEELGLGAMAPHLLARRINQLEMRVAALEQLLANLIGDEPVENAT